MTMHRTENGSTTSSKGDECISNMSSNSSPCQTGNGEEPSNYRHCHIVKRPDFDGYGFNLHSEKIKSGQYIGKVDANSPAEAAGLREGDQIIEVNGVNIGLETHKQVVQRIKAISNEVRLLLLDCNSIADGNGKTKTKNKQNLNSKLENTMPSGEHNAQAIGQRDSEKPSSASSLGQKEHTTTLNIVSPKSQSTVDVTDSSVNGNRTDVNGQHKEPNELLNSKPRDQLELSQAQSQTENSNKVGLNLNLTAAEMRAKLSAKKKFDPKNDSVDFKKKFDIIQKL